jgi:hypothetical protein
MAAPGTFTFRREGKFPIITYHCCRRVAYRFYNAGTKCFHVAFSGGHHYYEVPVEGSIDIFLPATTKGNDETPVHQVVIVVPALNDCELVKGEYDFIDLDGV